MAIGQIPVPAPHIEDSPTVSLCINQEWAATLIGQIWELKYPEAWGGTLEENRRARGEIRNLINMLMSTEECGNMAICCEPTIYIYRINPETGRLERSSDGGTVWTPDPADPKHVIIQQPPIVRDTVDATKCDAATNFSEHFNELITWSSENIGEAVTIFEFVAGAVTLIIDIVIIIATGGAGIALVASVSAAIFAAASAAFTAGKVAFDAYWTADNKDKVFCAAYCTIGDDGAFTEAQWNAFRSKVKLDLLPSPALAFVLTSVNAGGAAGGSNMASYGSAAEGDCADCHCDDTWCYTFEFTTTSYSAFWSGLVQSTNPAVFNTSWVSGTGWVTGNPPPYYSGIKIQNIWGNRLRRVTFPENGTDHDYMALLTTGDAASLIVDYGISDRVFDGSEPTYGYLGIGLRSATPILRVKLEGVGTNPFGADNC